MEYSVYDLIRILLRKWYVVLAAMCVLGVAAGVLSQRSYQKAVEDYAAYTAVQDSIPSGLGTTTASYRITASLMNPGTLSDDDEQVIRILDQVSHQLLRTMIAQYEPLLSAQENLTVAWDEQGNLLITAPQQEAEPAKNAIENYLNCLTESGSTLYGLIIEVEELSLRYEPPVLPSGQTDADLSMTVMAEPGPAPDPVRAGAKGAAFGLLFACFGILLVTFIRDSHANGYPGRREHGEHV